MCREIRNFFLVIQCPRPTELSPVLFSPTIAISTHDFVGKLFFVIERLNATHTRSLFHSLTISHSLSHDHSFTHSQSLTYDNWLTISHSRSLFHSQSISTALHRHAGITWRYKLMNHVSEYWYIGSILARSEIQKNKMEECVATGL